MTQTTFQESPDYVQSLARGLDVMRVFNRDQAAMTLSEVADRTGLARAVVRRCLLTLQHLGYVGLRGRQFFLTPRVLELGFGYLSSLNLTELALPWMEQLALRVDESCSLCVLDDEDIVYVARVPVRRVMTIALGVGARLPAAPTSLGRALLAGLDDDALGAWLAKVKLKALTPHTISEKKALKTEILKIRKQGYALVVQELELGLCSLAMPVKDRHGKVVAALNVGMQMRDGIRAHALKNILPALQETQTAIERAISLQWTATGN